MSEWKTFPLHQPDPGLYIVAIRFHFSIIYDVGEWKDGEWGRLFDDDKVIAFMAFEPYRDEDEDDPYDPSPYDPSNWDIDDLFVDPQFDHMRERVVNCLKSENIYSIKKLIEWSEADLWTIPNLGKLSMKTIKDALKLRGLALRRIRE